MATSSDRAADVLTCHILVVEDDEACLEAYGRVLRGAGYKVSMARDFRLALQVLEAEQPLHMLLVDIVMPGSVNGVALSRMARMRRKNLKVMYVTGYNIPGVAQEALGPILLKPLDDERLLQEVRSVLADTTTTG